MTAIEALEKLRTMQIELRSLERDIKELRARLYSVKAIDYSKDRISGSKSNDLADQVAHFTDKLEEAKVKWKRFVCYSEAIDEMISQIDSCEHRVLLHERYVNGGSWEQVAAVVGISRQWIDKRIFAESLEEFEKIFQSRLQEFTAIYNDIII